MWKRNLSVTVLVFATTVAFAAAQDYQIVKVASVAGAARFARRSCNWRTNAAVARVPRATVESPRSSRQRVSRLTKRRSAISEVEMPRLRRASARSRPNLRSAWDAGSGMDKAFDMSVVSALTDIK